LSRNDRNLIILGALAIVLLIVGFYFVLLGPLLVVSTRQTSNGKTGRHNWLS
jgi:uncharacterized membrane protein